MEQAGTVTGDRIEHGGVIPHEVVARIKALDLTVVTQPGFLAVRGGRFLDHSDPDHRGDLYPFKRLLDAQIGVVASSDAPYGPVNPWAVMAAAVSRRTEDNRIANPLEQVSAEAALHGYLTDALDPAGPRRRIAPGMPANLCVLQTSLADQLAQLHPYPVQHAVFQGQLVYSRVSSNS